MIFIRPKILRDDAQAAYETESKYKSMIEEQNKQDRRSLDIPLLPGEHPPRLPPLPPPPTPGRDTGAASTAEKEKAAQ
jgi:hypothetical protein